MDSFRGTCRDLSAEQRSRFLRNRLWPSRIFRNDKVGPSSSACGGVSLFADMDALVKQARSITQAIPAKLALVAPAGSAMSETRRKFVNQVVWIFAMDLTAYIVLSIFQFEFGYTIDDDDLENPKKIKDSRLGIRLVHIASQISYVCFLLLVCCASVRLRPICATTLFAIFVVCQAYRYNFGKLHFSNVISSIVFGAFFVGAISAWVKVLEKDLTQRKFIITYYIVLYAVENTLRYLAGSASSSVGALLLYLISMFLPLYELAMSLTLMVITMQLIAGGMRQELNPSEPIVGAILMHSAVFDTLGSLGLIYVTLCDELLGGSLIKRKTDVSASTVTSTEARSGTRTKSPEVDV